MVPSATSSANRLFRQPENRLCVPVIGDSVAQLLEKSVALLPDFPFQEIRLDYLPAPLQSLANLWTVFSSQREILMLATCRPERSGGRFRGSAQQEVAMLQAAAKAGARIVDLSLESAEELGPEVVHSLRTQKTILLLSFHDFAGTGDLKAVLARMRPFRPDLYKIVPTAHSLDDSLQMLQTLESMTNSDSTPLVGISMGEPGVLTRILGPRFGSAFTFAAATEDEATAPGQLTARSIADLYRIGALTSSTQLFGVAGDPIRSSLSPLMLNTAFRHTSVNAMYVPLKTATPAELFRVADALPLKGFSITMPLKQAILPWLGGVDPLAARIGAVNTVHRRPDGSFYGYNTDVAGIIAPLERRLSLHGARVLVLGAGGAARAAVFSCLDRGAHVFVHNRTQSAGEQLAAQIGATSLTRPRLALESFDVLINATPAGMRGNSLHLPVEPHELRAKLVFDLVYNPLETPLLALARSRGLETIPGIEMFVQQGARQFELWTGLPAPVEAMQRAVEKALAP